MNNNQPLTKVHVMRKLFKTVVVIAFVLIFALSIMQNVFNRNAYPIDFAQGSHIGNYPSYFFDSHFLVSFTVVQPNTALMYEVVSVLSNGTIIMGRREDAPEFGGDMVSHWDFVLELDNRYRHRRFNVVFPRRADGRMPWYTNYTEVHVRPVPTH